jgi:hypothetical protein
MSTSEYETKVSVNVLAHLTCGVCHCIPTEPVHLVPCEHLFCGTCIPRIGRFSPCPVCQSRCSAVFPITRYTLLHRIWSEISESCHKTTLMPPFRSTRRDGPEVIRVTRTVEMKELDAVLGLKIMLLGMAAGMGMHLLWPRGK